MVEKPEPTEGERPSTVGGASAVRRHPEFADVSSTWRRVELVASYALIICFYYMSGSALMNEHYSAKVLAMTAVSGVAYLTFARRHGSPRGLVWGHFLLLQGFLFLPAVIWSDGDLSTYLAISLILLSAFLTAQWMALDHFARRYTNVIVVFAAISLVGFGISLVFPQVALLFPLHEGTASVNYHDAVVYRFSSSRWVVDDLLLATRNAGICWEPGAYQVFLNLALCLLFAHRRRGHLGRWDGLKAAILVLTVVSTGSTTGLFVLLVLVIFYRHQLASLAHLPWKPILIGAAILMGLAVMLRDYLGVAGTLIERMLRKLGSEITSPGEILVGRLSLDGIKYFMEDGPLGFFGMSFAKWSFIDVPMWNSVIHTLVVLGAPFTLLLLYGYWKASKAVDRTPVVMVVLLLAGFFTQTLFWRVLFAYLAFAGIRAAFESIRAVKSPLSVLGSLKALLAPIWQWRWGVVAILLVGLVGGTALSLRAPTTYTQELRLSISSLPMRNGQPTPPGYILQQLSLLGLGIKSDEFEEVVDARAPDPIPELGRRAKISIDADAPAIAITLMGTTAAQLKDEAPIVGAAMTDWIEQETPVNDSGDPQFSVESVQVADRAVAREPDRLALLAGTGISSFALALGAGLALGGRLPSRSRGQVDPS